MSFDGWTKPFSLLLTIIACSFYSTWLSSAATATASDHARVVYATMAPPIDFTRLQFSAGLLDIVRMVKANVDPGVIKIFINHSGISYNPSAQEVIALKRLGVSNDIIVTMIGHRLRASESSHPQPPQMMRAPGLEQMSALPWPPSGGGYPLRPYPVHPFPVFGSLTSFNNSYPTFVNGQAIYSGYYLQTYPVFW